MKLTIKKGTTSKRLGVFIQDASGAGLTGLLFNSAGLTWYYWREDEGNAGATAVTLATMTRGTWASGGFIEKDGTNLKGYYELGVPDAALASGAGWVNLVLQGAAGMTPVVVEIQLVAYDPGDAVRLGLTALPNANAEAAGGLFTRGSGAGQINQQANGQIDCNLERILNTAVAAGLQTGTLLANVIRRGTAQAGAAGSITLDAGASATDNLYASELVAILGGTGAGQARQISAYVGSTKVASVSANWATNPDNTSVFVLLPAALLSGLSSAALTAIENQMWDAAAASHSSSGTMGAGLQTLYAADVDVRLDDSASPAKDRWAARWQKNGAPLASGITSPVITVKNRADGSTLINAQAMTDVGTGQLLYTATGSQRAALGAEYEVTLSATIDGATRTWMKIVGRDV